LDIFIIRNFLTYDEGDEIKDDKMGETHRMHGGDMRNVSNILAGNPERKGVHLETLVSVGRY
jgi:hypothetical protein